jgi:hypothetical protein
MFFPTVFSGLSEFFGLQFSLVQGIAISRDSVIVFQVRYIWRGG